MKGPKRCTIRREEVFLRSDQLFFAPCLRLLFEFAVVAYPLMMFFLHEAKLLERAC